MVFMDCAYLPQNNHGPYGPYRQICVQYMIFFEKKNIPKKPVNYKRPVNFIRYWVSES